MRSRIRRAIVPTLLCVALGWVGWTSGRTATNDPRDGGWCWYEVNMQMDNGLEMVCGTQQQEKDAEQSGYVSN